MKFKNTLRIFSGSRSCETIIFSWCFFTSEFFMTFNYLYFFTPSLIFSKSIFRFYLDDLFCSPTYLQQVSFLALMIIIKIYCHIRFFCRAKNNLRISRGSKEQKIKNIEAQQKN